MKNDQEIMNSIRAAIDDCTRGIDEAPTLQFRVAQKARGEKPMKKKLSLRIICVIAALMIGSMAALAAGVEDVNDALYKLWPEAARALRPLHLSDEHDGIRLDVISATLADDHYLVTWSLTDLGENSIMSNTDCTATLQVPVMDEAVGRTERLSWDPELHQAICATYFDYKPRPTSGVSPENADKAYFIVTNLCGYDESTVPDLLSLTNGQDYKVESVPVPSGSPLLYGDGPLDDAAGQESPVPAVLSPANSLRIPLAENVELSGIGWVDGKLHVQVHLSDYLMHVEADGFIADHVRYSCFVKIHDREGNEVICDDGSGEQRLEWAEGSDLWVEQIFPVGQDAVKNCTLDAEISTMVTAREELLRTMWMVSFPTNMIREE